MAEKRNQCPICKGRRVTPDVGNNQYQSCPMCQGRGWVGGDFDPALYWYIVNATIPAVVGSIVESPLRIQDHANFGWTRAMATSDAGVFSTELTDSATNRPFQNLPVNSENQWGTAQRPGLLEIPIIFERRGTIQIRLTNRVAGANIVQLAFGGYDLYPQA